MKMKNIFKKLCLVLFGVVLFISCSKTTTYSSADDLINDYKDGLKVISVDDLKAKMDDLDQYFFLIDVREENEHNFGFIPGSILIPGGSIIFSISDEVFWENEMMYKPEITDQIIVYCKKGKRSVIAARLLEQIGYKDVYYLDGGWKEWELAYPLLYDKNLNANAHPVVKDEGGC